MLGGFFRANRAPSDVDVEAQHLPMEPKPALTHTNLRAPVHAASLELDPEISASQRSRHDRCGSQWAKSAECSVGSLPHTVSSRSDTETDGEEPEVIAEYLFKYGFAFPPFWIAGICIIWSPLRAPPPPSSPLETALVWLPGKTDAEKDIILKRMRTAELKWAWRCLWAFIAFVTILVVGGLSIWGLNKI